MSTAPASAQSLDAPTLGWRRSILLTLGLHLSLAGICQVVYHSTIVPWYYLQIPVLTLIAYLTGRSFTIRLPGQLPRFIARPSCRDIHSFALSAKDVGYICSRVGTDFPAFALRQWRPVEEVLSEVELQDQSDVVLRHRVVSIELGDRRLIGPYLTQGRGVIGHGICAALMEEVGRWPGAPKTLVGRFFSWNEDAVVLGHLPINFAASAGVEEIIPFQEGYLCHTWQDLESGLTEGIKIHLCLSETYTPTIASSSFLGALA
jgi:hypothetical protein